jgi:MFS family permease
VPDPELRRILQLVSARALNTFGRAIISATVLWELYERTHSKLVLAGVGAVQVLPVAMLFVAAGALVDRSDRRMLTTAAAAFTGVVGVGLAIASLLGAPVWAYFALLFVQGCVNAIHAPASLSLIPLIIPREHLPRTNRVSASLQETAAIVGPAAAGLALAVVLPSAVYAFVAITGLASAAMYRALPKPRVFEDSGAGAVRRDWRVGLRFIFRSPVLLPALTLDMFAVLFAGVPALLPAVADDVLGVGPIGYGVLRAAQSAGAVAMSIFGGRLPPWRRPGRVLLIVVALFGAATIGFGLSTSFPLSVALLVACGALDNISVVIRLTLEQMVVPDAIRGRVSSVHYVFIGMSNELGAAESGVAAKLLGTVPAIVAGGAVAIVVVGFVAAKWRALAKMPPLAELGPETH